MLAYSGVTPILHLLHVNNLTQKEIIDSGVTLPLIIFYQIEGKNQKAFQFKKPKAKKKKTKKTPPFKKTYQ